MKGFLDNLERNFGRILGAISWRISGGFLTVVPWAITGICTKEFCEAIFEKIHRVFAEENAYCFPEGWL